MNFKYINMNLWNKEVFAFECAKKKKKNPPFHTHKYTAFPVKYFSPSH